MIKLKAWVLAARLRTLPLSVSGILVGTGLANALGYYNALIFALAIFTTIAFQVTSNFANDYGDGVRGTDDEKRIGPKRALQSGILSKRELKIGIWISIAISLLLSILLIYTAFGTNWVYFAIFFLLGLLSIWAAIKYTMGNSPYGYRGLGDLFVFVFFGLLSVCGSFFLHTKFITLLTLLPAIAIGLLCVGVLNLNNLRDVETDSIHNKNTMVVKMGFVWGKQYHMFLMVSAFVAFLVYAYLARTGFITFFYLLPFVVIFVHLNKVRQVKRPEKLDPELKKLALSTFFVALSFYISINYFS
ncbi:MAG: 1,4-dihydroxy-2-naphthoate octaprenyltransferase [Allomuricauda sp.]|nr:MAG: 1,4-dihydroxy-2-naphthoate octaprenyltransferase [Allomuricauda sp.]